MVKSRLICLAAATAGVSAAGQYSRLLPTREWSNVPIDAAEVR